MQIPAHTPITVPPVMVSNAYECETLIGQSPYPDSSISEVHPKYGFVSEQYWGPVIQRSSDASARALETCLDVVSGQWNADCWSSCPHASSMKTVSDCLHRNSYASGILQVILQVSKRTKR